MKKILSDAFKYFIENNRIFNSEAQFQFELAWQIQLAMPDHKVLLEEITATKLTDSKKR